MIGSLVSWLGGSERTVAFALLSGVFAFVAKGGYDLWLAKRKDRLDRVNQQLKLLYGPLYALNQASDLAWMAFREKVRPGGGFFGTNPPPTEEELIAWRIWIAEVFQPINRMMLDVLTKNADLLLEDDIPPPLQSFCGHVTAYDAVLKRWQQNDYSEHTSIINYPTSLLKQYLEDSFRKLKARQRELLGASHNAP